MWQLAYKIFLRTLCNQNRQIIIHFLLDNGASSVTQIARETGMNQSTLSHNLKRLLRCGFVSVRQEGKFRLYDLNKETIKPLIKLMDRHINTYCCKLLENKNGCECTKEAE